MGKRSERSRRKTTYVFDKEADSDDDFASSSPLAKKPKPQKKNKAKSSKTEVKPQRLPDKAKEKYEDDLQRALELSMHASQDGSPVGEETVSAKSVPTNESEEFKENKQRRETGAACHVDDAIVEIKPSSPAKRRSKKIEDEDDYEASDNQCESDDDSFCESDADSDCSFTEKRPKSEAAKRKKSPVSKKQARKVTTPKSKSGSKARSAHKTSSSAVETKKVMAVKVKLPMSVIRPGGGAAASPMSKFNQPKWTPPGRTGTPTSRGEPLKSSSSSTLRIGLSRKVRLKPLHASVASNG